MSINHVRIIYRKELIDILRDRRTLIAMIVVPIVLYPLLMFGSIQAMSYQVEIIQDEQIILGVVGEAQKNVLSQLVAFDTRLLEYREDARNPEDDTYETEPSSLSDAKVMIFDSGKDLAEAIRKRAVHTGVVFDRDTLVNDEHEQNHIEIKADWEEVRSSAAARRVQSMIQRIGEHTRRTRLEAYDLAPEMFEPFVVERVDLSAPSSILGQVLPLILILMTITGAIYPAIDLTAGERERGTLESLVVSPAPVLGLIVGKFLVVTTVAIMGAALNLASVSATVYFGGFNRIISETGSGLPIGKIFFILVSLVPFAVLMSAIMIAICSYARTFKEAQNYVTPVILAVLVPGGLAALPATRLEGIMLVMPVGNMVLLARDVLLGADIFFWKIALVLLSTSLYAVAAVAVASTLFGNESVLFADSASVRSAFSRKYARAADFPTASGALLLMALMFPLWFFIQSALAPGTDGESTMLLYGTAIFMPIVFVLLPNVVLIYRKVRLTTALALRPAHFRFVIAAIVLGVSSWVPAQELNTLQQFVLPLPRAIVESMTKLQATVESLSLTQALLLLALVPAVCEELLFRGILLGGLAAHSRCWTAIIASACIFAIFHFMFFKLAIAVGLGIILGYLRLRSGSVLPGMFLHFLHNGLAVLAVFVPWRQAIGVTMNKQGGHLPMSVFAVGTILFVLGVVLTAWKSSVTAEESTLKTT